MFAFSYFQLLFYSDGFQGRCFYFGYYDIFTDGDRFQTSLGRFSPNKDLI